ncbi:hypothetical protein KKD80_01240 [Patescibacteria group bacterium]|nr:hypothetical protein [Patescibacteria group bacterium]
MTTRKKKRVPRTLHECRMGSDLLLPHIERELHAKLAEERRRAEETEDRHYDEFSAEIEAHPIGHGGTPHGCT